MERTEKTKLIRNGNISNMRIRHFVGRHYTINQFYDLKFTESKSSLKKDLKSGKENVWVATLVGVISLARITDVRNFDSCYFRPAVSNHSQFMAV